MKCSYEWEEITFIAIALQNFLDDRIWSFLGFDNRIDERELEVSKKYINTKTNYLESDLPHPCLVHLTEEHSKPTMCSFKWFGVAERNLQMYDSHSLKRTFILIGEAR